MGVPWNKQFTWTPAAVARLTELWKDGFSAGHIETDLNGPSRNAVIGKAHRLGLASRVERRPARAKAPKPQRKTPFKPPPSDRKVERPRIGADSRMTMAFDVPRDAVTDLPADASPDAVRWLGRTNGCRWPLNETSPIEAHMVCNSHRYGEHSYCLRHFLISVQPQRARLDLSNAEHARRVAQGKANQRAHKQRLAAS